MGLPWKRLKQFTLMLILLSLSTQYQSQTSNKDDQVVRSNIQRALEALRVNDPETAVREFRAALQLDPKNIEARANIGVIAFMQGNYAAAAEDFREVLKLQPSISKVQAMLGMCEKRLGQQDSARSSLEKSFPNLQELKLRIQVGMDLVELYHQIGEIGKAANLLNTLTQLDPTNVNVQYAAYRTYSDLARSAQDTIAFVALDSAQMHLIIAQHLVNEGNLTSAIVQYRKALEVDPHVPGAHFELGEALLQESSSEKSREEAEKEFKAELALNPSDFRSECKLGELYLSIANIDLDAAHKSYTRALQIQPNYADAQVGMAKVLIKMGRHQEAIDHLLQATRVDLVNSNAHYLLGQLYRRLGRIEDATRELALFTDLEKSNKRIREAYREMHQIQNEKQPPNTDIAK